MLEYSLSKAASLELINQALKILNSFDKLKDTFFITAEEL